MEQWKNIKQYSRYMVSPDGEILDTNTGKLVAKQLAGKPQYYYVNVYRDDGKRKLKRVHRFVAEAYVEGRSTDFNIVDHIDRDKFNNHYTNLRWVDHSGNMRNREGSIYILGEAVKDYSQRYENPERAYSYFYRALSQGMSDHEAVDKYQEHLEYGMRRVVVEWEGVQLYLVDLCNEYNKDYSEVARRLSQGTPIWNALYDIPHKHTRSLEIPCKLVTGHWFPTKGYLDDYFNLGKMKSLELISNGATYQDMLSYDSLDQYREEVRGVRGTIKELCEHFNVSLTAVETNMNRKGMTLEEALFAPRLRVKKLGINGVYNTPKQWCESFNIDPKNFSTWKSKKKKSFKEAFEHFGIDTSGMTISEV